MKNHSPNVYIVVYSQPAFCCNPQELDSISSGAVDFVSLVASLSSLTTSNCWAA